MRKRKPKKVKTVLGGLSRKVRKRLITRLSKLAEKPELEILSQLGEEPKPPLRRRRRK